MKKTLKLFALMNDSRTKRNVYLLCIGGGIFAAGLYSLTNEHGSVQSLALSSYFLMIFQVILMSPWIYGASLELLYQSNRKKDILKYGIVFYNLIISCIYLLCTIGTILLISLFKDSSASLFVFVFVNVMTCLFTILVLLFQVHGYTRIGNACAIVYTLCFMGSFFLSFDFIPQYLKLDISLITNISIPYLIMIMFVTGGFVIAMDASLYAIHKGLKSRKKG